MRYVFVTRCGLSNTWDIEMTEFEKMMMMKTIITPTLEKVIEAKVSKHAKSLGWSTFKFVSPATPSVCDRIFINKHGVVLFVEFKQKGKRLTVRQQNHADELIAHKANVLLIDSIIDGVDLINAWDNATSIITSVF